MLDTVGNSDKMEVAFSWNSGPSITTKQVVLPCVCFKTLDIESRSVGDPVVGITTNADFDISNYAINRPGCQESRNLALGRTDVDAFPALVHDEPTKAQLISAIKVGIQQALGKLFNMVDAESIYSLEI